MNSSQSVSDQREAHTYENKIRTLIEEGQFFLAYDLSVEALENDRNNLLLVLLGALALINSGAVVQAGQLIEPIKEKLETTDVQAARLYDLLYNCVAGMTQADVKNNQTIRTTIELAKSIQTIRADNTHEKQVHLLKLAAEVYSKLWENTQSSEYLENGKNFSLECFKIEQSPQDGIRAAVLSWISGEQNIARELANQVIPLCHQRLSEDNELCQTYLTLGLAELFLENEKKAITAYQLAMEHLNGRHTLVVALKQSLQHLREHGLKVPVTVDDILRTPVVVIFGGQPIDPPDSDNIVFPPEIEFKVNQEIVVALDQINAEVGYSSAASGSDLLFIEAMLDRGAEVNIILPFTEEDFLNARIRYAGSKWERRFKNALKLATTVTWSTNDPYLQDDELFRYNNLLINGKAILRAENMNTSPHLLVVMDYLAPNLPGSAADFMDQWPDITHLHMIDLEDIRESFKSNAEVKHATFKSTDTLSMNTTQPRTIKAMLFADIVHYSKMKEQELPAVFDFLDAVNKLMAKDNPQLDLIESWGDALYVSMTGAIAMADYAFLLCNAMLSIDHTEYGLSVRPELRIGLHVGPVFESVHPLTGRKIIFGQHVSRAARIEPITVPGEIYTSEHFVAVLKAEENAARHEAMSTGEEFVEKNIPEYIGIMALPKSFGNQAVYHLRQDHDKS